MPDRRLALTAVLSALFVSPLIFNAAAQASETAWVFAHRANTVGAVRAAEADQGINAIEVDITHREEVQRKANNLCDEDWCAFHKGDRVATNLSTILQNVQRSETLHAVWLDVKFNKNYRPSEDYRTLFQTVRRELGTQPNSVRKFWGVWPSKALSSGYVEGVVSRIKGGNILGGQAQNLLVVEADNNTQSESIARFCRRNDIQCGISAGNPFIGGATFASGGGNLQLLDHQIRSRHINSVFMWTFNWRGSTEDDVMRILFRERAYWERMTGLTKYCGLEGNGAILGPQNDIYSRNFCSNGDNDDACSTANREILTGPNALGTRQSNIGEPRNGYSNRRGNCL